MITTDGGQSGDGAVSLGDVFAVIRHRWRPIFASVVFGVLLATAAYALATPSYVATATVQVYPLPTDLSTPSVSPKDISMATEVGVVTTASVANDAAKKIGWTGTLPDLLGQVSVTSPADSQLLNIDFTAGTAKGSADGANAFANEYLAQRAASAKAAANSILANITKQVTALQKAIDSLNTKIAGLPVTSDTRAALARQRDAAQSQMQSLNAIASNVSLLSLTPGSLVGPAAPPDSKSAPRGAVYLAAGLMLGLFVGLCIAAIRHRSDPKIRTFDDLEQITGLPVLGRISPHLRSRIGPHGVEIPDEFRQLAVRMVASVGPAKPLMYLVANSSQHGKNVPSQVAEALAASGSRVGLAITDAEPVPSGLEGSGVTIIRLGPEAQLLRRLHDSNPFPELAAQAFDTVIIDAVNFDMTSSAIALAHVSTAVALVAAENRTDRDALLDDIREMGRTRTPLTGLIVVTRPRRFFRRARPSRPAHQPAEEGAPPLSLTSQAYIQPQIATPAPKSNGLPQSGKGPVEAEEAPADVAQPPTPRSRR